jgi:hypothetical protein
MDPAFTEKTVRSQSRFIQTHISRFFPSSPLKPIKEPYVDIINWLSFVTLDIIGDLG